MVYISRPATVPDPGKRCIFCRQPDGTVLAGEIIASNALGYLTPAGHMEAGVLVLEEGHWLVIPWEHIGATDEPAFGWEQARRELMMSIPAFGVNIPEWPPFRCYFLHGVEAGSTIFHRHDHVRLVSEGDSV
ncbi:MAG TPA: hypothetical protein VMS08_05645 [Candidatus Saccharimonadia bacterium]|nr:hypothetical protein [Candidatus Saccharimonadia bacterium]